MSTNPRRKKRPRGSILLLAIFFLIVLFSLAVTFFRIIPAEFHSASQARRAVQAQYAADAGVREAVAWLKSQSSVDDTKLDDFSTNHDDNTVSTQKVDDDWSYTVAIQTSYPIRKIYDVVSTAYYRDRAVSEIRTTVRNETFAKYALFYDTWGPDFLFTMASNAIQGPFHTNDYFHLAAPSSTFWSDGKQPFVNGALAEMTFSEEMDSSLNTMGTGVGDGNLYYGGNYAGNDSTLTPFESDGTPNTDRYNKMINGGREKLTQVSKVDFPEAVTELREKAWGETPPADADLAALVSSKGPLLVNTDAGPNEPGGKLKGGILYTNDAKSVRLEITLGNGNHQKTVITDSTDTVIPGAGATTYKWKEQKYSALVPQPDKAVTTGGDCKTGHTETRYHDVKVYYTETVFGEDPSCGTETVFIPGSGGVSTPIQVYKECNHDVTKSKTESQPYDKFICDEYNPKVTTLVPQPPKVKTVDADYPGAYLNGTTNHSGSEPPEEGTYVGEVTSSTSDLSIPTVNSVIEVNDADYKIPWYDGIKVNGKVVPADDPENLLTVHDGSTVTVHNDTVVGGKNLAEYTVMDGRINGVTFSDGDLLDVQGTVKGSKHPDEDGNNLAYRGRTIATDIKSNKDLEISGNILQYYDGSGTDANGNSLHNSSNQLIVGNSSPNADHILGIVAHNITLKQPTWQKSKQLKNTRNGEDEVTAYKGLNVYGVLMAGRKVDETTVDGGFGADPQSMKSDDDLGDFNLFGGIISGNARSTQLGKSDGTSDGFRMNLNYDEVAALNLEDFPTTNTYSVVRYVSIGLGNLDTGFGSLGGN
jgi:hypothetical protein